MNNQCEQCPPITFRSHEYCHRQYALFKNNLNKLSQEKENHSIRFSKKVTRWEREVRDIYRCCHLDADYFKYGSIIEKLNEVMEIVIEICDTPWSSEHGREDRRVLRTI